MKWQPVSLLDKSLWQGTGERRSEEITPLYIERYMGPRQSNIKTYHSYWELICVPSGNGQMICRTPLELAPGMVYLLPPGLNHRERADGNLDTIWIGLKGSHLSGRPRAQPAWVQNQVLAGRVEQLWMFAIRQAGPIGPELDALSAGIIAHFFRLLSEGAEVSGASDVMERAILLFQRNFSQKLTIADTARRLGYSTGHFCRAFKQRTGQTPIDYLASARLRHARRLLEYTELPIAQVAGQAGYEDQLYFSRVFHKAIGLTPTAYRRRTRA